MATVLDREKNEAEAAIDKNIFIVEESQVRGQGANEVEAQDENQENQVHIKKGALIENEDEAWIQTIIVNGSVTKAQTPRDRDRNQDLRIESAVVTTETVTDDRNPDHAVEVVTEVEAAMDTTIRWIR